MITELIENKERFFWSKSEDGIIIVGGYNNGQFYGQIDIIKTNPKAILK